MLDYIFLKDSNTLVQLGTWKDLVCFLVIRMKIPRVKKIIIIKYLIILSESPIGRMFSMPLDPVPTIFLTN